MLNQLRLPQIKIVLILLLFIFSLPLQAIEKNTFKFLSHEQFQKLTEPEKKTYLKEIRRLLEDMTENAKVSLFHYLFLPNASAVEVESFKRSLTNTGSELGQLDTLLSMNRGLKRAMNDHPNMIASKSEYEVNTKAFIERMNSVRTKELQGDNVRRYNQLYNEFQRDYPQHIEKISPLKKSSAVVESSKSISSKLEQKQTRSEFSEKKISKQPSAIVPAAEPNPTKPICIYAGFVIYGDKCSANKKLPTDFVLNEIRPNMFKCDSENEILCNPLLFGFKKNCFKLENKEVCSEKPLCIERSVSATKNCLKLSDETEQLNQILELWKNPKNRKVYEKFTKDLNQLCNAENIASNDVKQTCQVAARRFNKIIETNYPGKVDLKIKTTEPAPAKTNK